MKFAVLALIACLPAAAIARQADQREAHSHALGSVDFKNSGNDAAQPAFQRGVALLHSFEYEDAAEAFREAQKADASQLGRERDALALIETASAILRGVTIPDDNPDARNIVDWLAFRQGLETGKWDAYPGGFPTVDAAMKQPRPTPRALSIATSAAYESAIASLRGQKDTGPARKVIATFRAEADLLPADAPRRAVLHRLSTTGDARHRPNEAEPEGGVHVGDDAGVVSVTSYPLAVVATLGSELPVVGR